jgi:ribosomal protein L16/L10AE
LVDTSQPNRTPIEQQLYDDVRVAERQLEAARAARNDYMRRDGSANHTITDLARIFGISREAVYKILVPKEGAKR